MKRGRAHQCPEDGAGIRTGGRSGLVPGRTKLLTKGKGLTVCSYVNRYLFGVALAEVLAQPSVCRGTAFLLTACGCKKYFILERVKMLHYRIAIFAKILDICKT